MEITSFIYIIRVNLLCVRPDSDKQLIDTERFLKLPKLLMLIK